MKSYYVDLHIQSRYTPSTSNDITVENLAQQAQMKGLHIVGTGDCLHPTWRKELKKELQEDNGMYRRGDVYFIPSVEIKDKNRVHHLIFLESLADFDILYERFASYGKLDKIGVPTVHLDGNRIAEEVFELNGVIGPAHIFVPWESLYKSFSSITECYGDCSHEVPFVELGLSADTHMGDKIEELTKRSFLSDSDCHSLRALGREFNGFLLGEPSFEEIKKALGNSHGRKVILNVGLNPKEGKYYLSACIKCHTAYRYEDAVMIDWKCERCGGIIRKGVRDRAKELSTYENSKNPEFRPPYIHMLPLYQIITIAYPRLRGNDIKNKVTSFVERFQDEITLLLNTDINEVCEVDKKIGEILEMTRKGELYFVPGGGGKFGKPVFKAVDEDSLYYTPKVVQRRLFQ